jgi:hypothetical protein
MVDPREIFSILDDGGAGEAPKKMQEGDSPASANGLIGFSFKDSSGNVVLPQLNASGQVPVTSEAAGTCYYANGELPAGSLSEVDITNAEVTILVTKTYQKIGFIFSCLHASLVRVVYVDDADGTPTETVIGEAIVGPGQYTADAELTCFELDTTGGTGTQKLKLKGKNFYKLSSMRGSISAIELP